MTDRQWIWAGAILGFALGGFFDGILLHQILQWHHLLSLVPGIGDLRAQVMWDGVFHALMYVALLAAVVLAIRKRRTLAMSDSRWLAGWRAGARSVLDRGIFLMQWRTTGFSSCITSK